MAICDTAASADPRRLDAVAMGELKEKVGRTQRVRPGIYLARPAKLRFRLPRGVRALIPADAQMTALFTDGEGGHA